MRTLYDIEYPASGCALSYDENTIVDNTTGTYATAYALAGIALFSAAILACKQKKKALLMVLFFLTSGIGYAVTGASHQFAGTQDDWKYRILGKVGVGIILLGNAFLMRTGILFFFYGLSLIANTAWIAINGGIIALAIIFDEQQALVAGLALALTYLGMCVLYVWVMCRWGELPGSKWAMVSKELAMLTNIAGILELSGSCGSGGYENCFKDCSLPDSTAFNHNAIFHVLMIVGLCLLTIGELNLPTHALWDFNGPPDDVSDWETRAKSSEDEYP